ncbi:MAG: 4Fe-4S binding protein [Caldisericia bacterium]|nr:4Fe-4S binding protein [Caldisericia bacterium]
MQRSLFSNTNIEYSNSLEELSGEFSNFSEVSLFIPSIWKYSQFPPRVEIVNLLINFLLSKGIRARLLYDGLKMKDWIQAVDSEKIELIDLNNTRYMKTDGIGEKKVQRYGKSDNLRIPILKNIFINSVVMDSSAIIPILTPHPSNVFLMNGVISSFMSIVPTETRTRILLEAGVSKHHDALVELFSLIYKKVLLAVYDFSHFVNWSGSGEVEHIKVDSTLVTTDAVAGDALIYSLFGWPKLIAKNIRTAIDLRLGDGLLDETLITGCRPELPKIRRPVSDRTQILFPFSAIVKFLVQAKPDSCTGCMECTYACPNGSITVIDTDVSINHSMCVKCFACVDACPEFVLSIKRRP